MSEQLPKRIRKRVRASVNEGTMVKSVAKRDFAPQEVIERFVGEDEASPAYVSVGGRLTKNLGNYESVQISVSVTLPCKPTEKAVRDMRAKASGMVEEFVDMELQNLDK